MKKINYARALKTLIYRFLWPHSHQCVLCNRAIYQFLPYRGGSTCVPPLMHAIGGVGSDVDHFECPWCGCHDRERHLFLYMTAIGLLPDMSGKSVLHFAPEKRLSQRIREAGPSRYVKCDLFPQASDVIRVNMLEIQFEDDSFDLLVANHVMEHVADDRRALAEIVRVLKPGGCAILQTPFSSKLHRTWSDSGIDSDEARLQAFGQEDHVRLYGVDIFERFEQAGLKADVKSHRELLPDINSLRFGVNEAEPFFLFYKPS